MSEKINAEDILRYLEKINWNTGFDLAVSEFCPYHENRRIDLFYFSRWNRQTKGYEIKVNRQDFLKDKKWKEYLKFCTWFYFVVPKDLIKLDELPKNIGLVEVWVEETKEDDWRNRGDFEKDQQKFNLNHKIVRRARKTEEYIEEKDYIRSYIFQAL